MFLKFGIFFIVLKSTFLRHGFKKKVVEFFTKLGGWCQQWVDFPLRLENNKLNTLKGILKQFFFTLFVFLDFPLTGVGWLGRTQSGKFHYFYLFKTKPNAQLCTDLFNHSGIQLNDSECFHLPCFFLLN